MLPVPDGLKSAYEATHYRVFGLHPAMFTLETEVARVDLWLGSMGCTRATLITGWNPFSAETPAALNAEASARLALAVAAAGRSFVDAEGRSPDGAWAETSICVLEADDEEVDAWLVAFGQNAALQLSWGAKPYLVWHPMYRSL